VFAGNETQGLRYGTIETPNKFFLSWKEDPQDQSRGLLYKYLLKMCGKARFLEIIRDFVLFDSGVKKLPRPHQYFAVKSAQAHAKAGKGGIIWHTQGSGKSIVMVFLAKWLTENYPNARILVITDRDELDDQIENRVFKPVGVDIHRASSGADLLAKISATLPRIVCTLIHKFGNRGETDFEEWIKTLEESRVPVYGDFFVFIDEAHRSHKQDGKFHRALKAVLPNAIFIGFTGTPLLANDADVTREIFGDYIHKYQQKEAVQDGVVLDLAYDARDIDQYISSPDKLDDGFSTITEGMTKKQRGILQKRYATLSKVHSAKSRLENIVDDIVQDFTSKKLGVTRLALGRGNAMLVAPSIYDACRYYDFFQNTPLRDNVAVITSYEPHVKDIKTEQVGLGSETEKQFIYDLYENGILKYVTSKAGMTKAETYETNAKHQFLEEPDRMKLLIVVDKLLTGFDAPHCSVLYIDKKMQDHGLFQAMCRTNRLDDPDKTVGLIIDYRHLADDVTEAITVYSSAIDQEFTGGADPIVLKTLAENAKIRLEDARDSLKALEEQIPPPKTIEEALLFFCGNVELEDEDPVAAARREALYQGVSSLLRAAADLEGRWEEAEYSPEDVSDIKVEIMHFEQVRQAVKFRSADAFDTKPYESDMRYLIDTFVKAKERETIFSTHNIGLLKLIDEQGAQATFEQIEKELDEIEPTRDIADLSKTAAEMVENNIRKTIIKSKLSDPVYYDKMSDALNRLIEERKAKTLVYADYCKKIEALVKQAQSGNLDGTPTQLDTSGKKALWNNLGQNLDAALQLHHAMLHLPDSWRGNVMKERNVQGRIHEALQKASASSDTSEVQRLFGIIKEQAEY